MDISKIKRLSEIVKAKFFPKHKTEEFQINYIYAVCAKQTGDVPGG